MNHIKAVVFDVFETLAYNNQQLWIEAFKDICRQQNLQVDVAVLWREWKSFEMRFRGERLNLEEPEKSPPFISYEEAWHDCFLQAFSKLGLEGDPKSAARCCVLAMGHHELYPDAVEVLLRIQRRWKTGILSNADDDFLGPVLGRLGLKFDVVLSSEEARCYKPMPSLFLQVIERLGVAPHEVVYVGDNQFDDVKGAKGVGMRAVWLNRRGDIRDTTLSAPDHAISSLIELPPILEG